jgi:hypothetical protein
MRSQLPGTDIGSFWLLKRLTPVSILVLTVLFSNGIVGVLRLAFQLEGQSGAERDRKHGNAEPGSI